MSLNFPHSHLAEKLLDELHQEFPTRKRPEILWKNRLRVTAGLADYFHWRISLSSRLLDSPEKVAKTLRHEYAHLLAVHRVGRKGAGHGPAWRQAMMDLGESPEVYHQYQVRRNQARQKVLYVCKRCGATIERKRRLPKFRRYLHRQCGGTIAYHSSEEITR